MKIIEISDELYARLRNCVVDPFDDMPESVISRLIDIVDKAKDRLSPWEQHEEDSKQQEESKNGEPKRQERWKQQAQKVL